MKEITTEQIKKYLSNYELYTSLEVAIKELYWLANKHETVEGLRQRLLSYCERNDI